MSGDPARLARGLRWRLFLSSLSLQASWNPQRMQNLGLLAIMLEWLRPRPRRIERDRRFCRRYYEFFNTNPYLANFLVGCLVRLESAREADDDNEVSRRMVRDSLGRALASIGDQLFWLGLRPVIVMGTGLLGMYGRWVEVLSVCALFACGQLLLRWRALGRGFAQGLDVVDDLADPRWHRAIAWAARTGMVLTGTLAGAYLVQLLRRGSDGGGALLLAGAAVGMGLPLLYRHRPPGEVLVLLGAVLAFVLTFALPGSRS